MEMELIKTLNVQDGDVLVVKAKESVNPTDVLVIRENIQDLF